MVEKGWQDEQLRVLVLEAVALDAGGKQEQAVDRLTDALALAEPGGIIRTFVDEGPPMARLLYVAATRGRMPDYIGKLLAAFPAADSDITKSDIAVRPAVGTDIIEPLSERELEVLHLIAEGLTNPEIAARLYLSLNTIKAHTRNIYGKLGVHTRTQAVVRARAFGVLSST
jgi:LuxR family maltose regulon positive regulatory protein